MAVLPITTALTWLSFYSLEFTTADCHDCNSLDIFTSVSPVVGGTQDWNGVATMEMEVKCVAVTARIFISLSNLIWDHGVKQRQVYYCTLTMQRLLAE